MPLMNPVVFPKFRAFDANGEPLAGGLLYSYLAGTLDEFNTYTTRDGGVANSNPVTLDANGEADVWLYPGVDYKLELHDSNDVLQWTVDDIPSAPELDSSTVSPVPEPGGRLTLATATPVLTSDTTATTIFYTPYKNSSVPLYDGTSWSLHTIASELSQTLADNTKSPAAAAVSSTYDLFVWLDSTTLRLSRGPAWTTGSGSSSARGTGAGTTELERKDGRLVNKNAISNGPGAQKGLYVGSIRTNGSTQVVKSFGVVNIWNMYNRTRTPLRLAGEASGSGNYNYTSATVRQANANTGNQLDVLVGLNEDAVDVSVNTAFFNTSANVVVLVSIGLDSTTAETTGVLNSGCLSQVANIVNQAKAQWTGFVGIGRHTIPWLESSAATGTTTWQVQTVGNVGMTGSMWA